MCVSLNGIVLLGPDIRQHYLTQVDSVIVFIYMIITTHISSVMQKMCTVSDDLHSDQIIHN